MNRDRVDHDPGVLTTRPCCRQIMNRKAKEIKQTRALIIFYISGCVTAGRASEQNFRNNFASWQDTTDD